ncbi:hypothetical protein BKA67DRAFT_647148 [Truncatella angustata]|uniref:Uncharacterized protein n=1 Tax=Truncatella angustata TaxID=152316 RepID=A0A9P8ZXP6_9PEZI|nr:uncharacterized protein BKA67DRAFT_647148 [Truncatella angustata]KAH6653194.1 hypothetical protein BKA67DRAFT_647148 [Truncatella angustata]
MPTCNIASDFLNSCFANMSARSSPVEPLVSPSLEDIKFRCPRCPRSFKRMEHLKRHRRTHDGTKQFVCSTCSKGFARSDILHRHELIHSATTHDAADTRRKRACLECAKARERCTKGAPCSRCSARSLKCTYPQGNSEDLTRAAVQPTITIDSQQRHLHYQSPEYSGLAALNMTTSNPLTEYGPEGFGNMQYADVYPGSLEGATIPVTFPQAARTPISTSTQSPVPSLGVPSSTQDIYNPFGYAPRAASTLGSLQIQPTYSPAIASPISWTSTTETADVAYQALPGLGISRVDLSPTSHSEIQSPVIPIATSSYMSGTWITDSRLVQQNYSDARNQSVSSDAPCSSPWMSLSTMRSTSPAFRSSRDAPTPVSPWNDTFGGLNVSHSTPTYAPVPQRRPNFATMDQESFWIPPLSTFSHDRTETHTDFPRISVIVYTKIVQRFRKLCINPTGAYASFLSVDFPSLGYLNLFVGLYFQHFDPVLPVIHSQQHDLDDFWPLSVALSAVGCQYSKSPELLMCAGPLHEFLRRALAVELDSGNWARHVVPLAQALVLSQIGSLYGGSKQSIALARARHRTLVEIVETYGLLRSQSGWALTGLVEESWRQWLGDETKRRLGYSIWLLDSMSAYHFGQRPLLCLENAQCELPYASLWTAKTASEWLERFNILTSRSVAPVGAGSKLIPPGNRTLPAAMNVLHLNGEMTGDLGDFGQLILLHGIYEDTIRSRNNFSPTRSSLILSAKTKREAARSIASQHRTSLEYVEMMNRAAMNDLYQTGIEPTSVLHLAIARIVLLVPYDSIQMLAKSVASQQPGRMNLPDNAIQAEQAVLHWAQQADRSARVAVIHCGICIWHLRRNSNNAFYEPISAFLATLTVWAYSRYTSRTLQEGQEKALELLDRIPSGEATRKAGPNVRPEPEFIQLDGPNDDQTLQLFIRLGGPSTIRAHMTGVGNIFSSSGPVNIVKEGRKILASVSSVWGRSQEYAVILEALEIYSMDNLAHMT